MNKSPIVEIITLRNLLPMVFCGMEDSERLRGSQIWMKENLTLERGCRVCVQSESGGGKSSLISFLYGNRHDYRGEILFNHQDISTFNVENWCDIRTTHLALLPQEMRLFPELTVMQNLQLKNRLTHHKTQEELFSLLDRLGIVEKANTYVGKLSIGQQQRVAIIRAICQPFDFILLDEPVSHLDKKNNMIVADIVEKEASKQGAGIISTSVGNPLLLNNATFITL